MVSYHESRGAFVTTHHLLSWESRGGLNRQRFSRETGWAGGGLINFIFEENRDKPSEVVQAWTRWGAQGKTDWKWVESLFDENRERKWIVQMRSLKEPGKSITDRKGSKKELLCSAVPLEGNGDGDGDGQELRGIVEGRRRGGGGGGRGRETRNRGYLYSRPPLATLAVCLGRSNALRQGGMGRDGPSPLPNWISSGA